MATRKDLLTIGTWPLSFVIAWYPYSTNWGVRKLGGKRYALDLGKLAFIYQDYRV